MAVGIPADLVDEVYKRSMERITEMAIEVIKAVLRPDGTTFGDTDLNRGERIQRFQDYAQRGVLDALETVKPELLKRLVEQYNKDMSESPFVRRGGPPTNSDTPEGY